MENKEQAIILLNQSQTQLQEELNRSKQEATDLSKKLTLLLSRVFATKSTQTLSKKSQETGVQTEIPVKMLQETKSAGNSVQSLLNLSDGESDYSEDQNDSNDDQTLLQEDKAEQMDRKSQLRQFGNRKQSKSTKFTKRNSRQNIDNLEHTEINSASNGQSLNASSSHQGAARTTVKSVLKDDSNAQREFDSTEILTFGQETSNENYGMVPRQSLNQEFYPISTNDNTRGLVVTNQPYQQVVTKKLNISNHK